MTRSFWLLSTGKCASQAGHWSSREGKVLRLAMVGDVQFGHSKWHLIANMSVTTGTQSLCASPGEAGSAQKVKLILKTLLYWVSLSVPDSSWGLKCFGDLELELSSPEMRLWYLSFQPCLRSNEQSLSPPSAKTGRMECEKSQELSQLLPLSLSICVCNAQDG